MKELINGIRKEALMNNLEPLLMEGLRVHNMPVPEKFAIYNGVARWGRHNEYWARKVGAGYVYGNWKTDEKYYIFHGGKSTLTKAELAKIRRFQYENERLRMIEAAEKTKKAKRIFDSLSKADLRHPYLVKKAIKQIPDNIHQIKDSLVIPIYNSYKEIISIQFIDQTGDKRFLSGASKQGGLYVICEGIEKCDHLNICEGWATGMSLYEILGEPIVVAFDAGSLKLIAQILRAKYPKHQIRFYADNDCDSRQNKGIEAATEAAKLVDNAIVLYPEWLDEARNPIKIKVDWNDIYYEHEGEVKMIKSKVEMALQNIAQLKQIRFYTHEAKLAKEKKIYMKREKK